MTQAPSDSDDKLIFGIKPYNLRKNEPYMNEEQVAHFRNILKSWKADITGELQRTRSTIQDETVNHPDANDRASQETDMSLELRSRDRERKLSKKIDEAMHLLDAGDYGYCENCGVDIGVKRLEARPTATMCVDCKTLEEIRERRSG